MTRVGAVVFAVFLTVTGLAKAVRILCCPCGGCDR